MILNSGNTLLILFVFFQGGNSNPAKKANKIPAGRLEWDQKTLTKVSSSDKGKRYSGYDRLAQLANYGLICVYESDGNIVTVKSSDDGATWSLPVVLAPKKLEVNMAVRDILKLSDGSLLVMYNARPSRIEPSRRFGIYIKKSVDNGITEGLNRYFTRLDISLKVDAGSHQLFNCLVARSSFFLLMREFTLIQMNRIYRFSHQVTNILISNAGT